MANKVVVPRAEAESWGAQLRKGCLELAILASLWNEKTYGLGILRMLENSGLTVAEGTLYAILNRLRSDGLVVSEWLDAGTGHPRKYYTLTEAGRASTTAMTGAWKEFAGQMDNVLRTAKPKGVNHGSAK